MCEEQLIVMDILFRQPNQKIVKERCVSAVLSLQEFKLKQSRIKYGRKWKTFNFFFGIMKPHKPI